MSLEMKKGVDLNTTVAEPETVTEESVAATTNSQNVSEVKSTETETTSVKADESASDSISAEGDKSATRF